MYTFEQRADLIKRLKTSRFEYVAFALIAAFIALVVLGVGLLLGWKWLAWLSVVPGWSMIKLSLDYFDQTRQIEKETSKLISDLASGISAG